MSVLLLVLAGFLASTVSGEGTTWDSDVTSGSTPISSSTDERGNETNISDPYTTTSATPLYTITTPESTEQSSIAETSTELDTSTAESTESSTTAAVETSTEEELGFINILDPDQNFVSTTVSSPTTTEEYIESTTLSKQERKERLSDQIRAVIQHYKKHRTVTVPDASIPDPMSIPTNKKKIGGSEITFLNTKVYGMSNFTIEHVNTDLDKMQVYVAIYIKRLVILGNYTAKYFFGKAAGPYNATLLYVEASGAAELQRDEEGNLQASESEMDMTFMESQVKFGSMGLMGTFLQGIVASAGPILFDSIKPFVLSEINTKVKEDINKKIKTIGKKFLLSGNKPPLDVALEKGRKYIKENGYDPYYIENYIWKYMPKNESIFKVNISRLSLTGLSNIRRVGEVSLSMDSGTIQMGVHLATGKLKGQCTWSVTLGKLDRVGQTNFTVDYVQGRGLVNQSLDISQHPVLEDLDVNAGKVRIQVRGTGPFDIILEAVVNTLPDLIRHVIVDAIELPLKFAFQHILSEINVEEMLEKQLPELDKMGL